MSEVPHDRRLDLSPFTPQEIGRAVVHGTTNHIRRAVAPQARAALAQAVDDDAVLPLRDDGDETVYTGATRKS